MSSDKSASRNIAWGPWILAALGSALFFLGAGRFFMGHRFGLSDALHCGLTVIPAGLLLLVFDYVLHHAKLVSILVLIMAGMLAFSSPVFDVSLGLVLIGAVAGPAISEWKSENGPHRPTMEPQGENKVGQ